MLHSRRLGRGSRRDWPGDGDVILRSEKTGAKAIGTLAIGSLALGALAFGALAIGALAIGKLAILSGADTAPGGG